MALFAQEYLDSVKDIVYEGSISYYGLLSTVLAPGHAINIAATGFTTGLESAGLPVVAVDVEFRERSGGTSYATTLSFSNRRAPFSGAAFMRPAVTGQAFGGEGDALMQAAEMGQGHHLAGLSGPLRGDGRRRRGRTRGDGVGRALRHEGRHRLRHRFGMNGATGAGLSGMNAGTASGLDTLSNPQGPQYGYSDDPGDYGVTGRGNSFGSDGSTRNIIGNGNGKLVGPQTSADVLANRTRGNQQEDFT
jgi:hypothetical protein